MDPCSPAELFLAKNQHRDQPPTVRAPPPLGKDRDRQPEDRRLTKLSSADPGKMKASQQPERAQRAPPKHPAPLREEGKQQQTSARAPGKCIESSRTKVPDSGDLAFEVLLRQHGMGLGNLKRSIQLQHLGMGILPTGVSPNPIATPKTASSATLRKAEDLTKITDGDRVSHLPKSPCQEPGTADQQEQQQSPPTSASKAISMCSDASPSDSVQAIEILNRKGRDERLEGQRQSPLEPLTILSEGPLSQERNEWQDTAQQPPTRDRDIDAPEEELQTSPKARDKPTQGSSLTADEVRSEDDRRFSSPQLSIQPP